jgi:hypothetical protein
VRFLGCMRDLCHDESDPMPTGGVHNEREAVQVERVSRAGSRFCIEPLGYHFKITIATSPVIEGQDRST